MPISHESLSDTLYNTLLKSQEQVFKKKRKKDFDVKAFTEKSFESNKNIELYSNIQDVLKYCFEYLQSKEIHNYDQSHYFIDFHQRNCFGAKKKETFSWHKDDNSVGPFKTYTFIFYLRKDRTVHGGNLLYKENKQEKTHIVLPKTMLHFKGDLSHCPEPCSGFGCRDVVVVFIPKLKDTITSRL